MCQQEVIEPSDSPWSSPVVLVRKWDESLRFCVDYRKPNTITKKDCYPLPRVNNLLDSLGDAQWFFTLDLQSRYWQVEVDPTDREKTAFTTQHEFRVMPFGLCNAPSTFQCLMELVLVGLNWEMCLAYLDDVVVFGHSWEEHLQRLRTVLTWMRKAQLKLHPKKCQFFKQRVVFLRHVVSRHGVSTDPDKIKAVTKWLIPSTQSQLRWFQGLASYYQRFIGHFAEIAVPLCRLLDKDVPFKSMPKCILSTKRETVFFSNFGLLSYKGHLHSRHWCQWLWCWSCFLAKPRRPRESHCFWQPYFDQSRTKLLYHS